jgi:ribosome maturation factor RimP
MSLVELNLSRHRGSLQIRAVVYRAGNTGVEDCSRVHHALLPRLELAFPGKDMTVEVSSPGIDRLIKDGSEFVHYLGRGVKCYRTDISGWTRGILKSADEKGLTLAAGDTTLFLEYGLIAKAKLDHSVE